MPGAAHRAHGIDAIAPSPWIVRWAHLIAPRHLRWRVA